MSSSRQIFNLAIVNVAITAVGVITTTFTAWYFGASREMDIWFAASACQQIILGLVQTGQLSEIFLPEYIRLRETKGREEAFACYSVVLNWAVLGSLLLVIIGYFLSAIITGWIGAGFTATEKTFLQAIFVGLLPLLPLQVAAGIQQMLGNAERWFGRFEIPVLVGSIISLFLIILGHAVLGIWLSPSGACRLSRYSDELGSCAKKTFTMRGFYINQGLNPTQFLLNWVTP